ncbi:hypothetical protein L2K70_04820 [Nocardioides KLBMP 9356]|uniref:Uncharacterized protein n=1 Tax=Nocardioides potassii TaxID=2911371 RepID=A0ABS9H9D2_9ACTN|nr:hypothetical protein [Nocardioides potassii]MCF6376918.1 hypothetical protein [Nocardioides potassii]
MSMFRAIWPIVDESMPYADLCREATADLPRLITQAKARLLRPGGFSIAPAAQVPGSGRVTESVLIYTAPAEPMPWRSYWKGAA